MRKLKGIFPALITPFTADGKINKKAITDIINMNIEKGVDGFYVCGSTGESFLLSLEERKQVLQIAAEIIHGRCALIAHIGCIGTEHALELAEHAKGVGVDAISSIPPFYYKFSFEEIKNYYLDIVNSATLPMIIYNFPALSGVSFTAEHIKEFAKDERIIGIKHTSMDLYQMERMKEASGRMILFNGHDEVFLAGLAMGADGAIGSTYNFMAHKFIKIKELFEENKLKEAKRLQIEANEIIAVLIKTGVFQGIKYILGKQGIDCGPCRKPFKELTISDKELLDSIMHLI
jgi:N-acetylneuraminate lyase